MSKLKAPRGCPDLLPEQNDLADSIINTALKWAKVYGYKTYKTPLFESAEVFTKTLGDTSDIVTKEMYSFTDKKGEVFVLRPEATAPLVRLFISEKLQHSVPVKMFTYGPMFRYERPQKGRQRQFHQIGIENLGAPKDLFTHFEILSFGWNFLTALSISSPLKVKLNGIGSLTERQNFKKDLINFLKPNKHKLSEDSQKRLEENPLRILDSKSEEDKALLSTAPLLPDYLSSESKSELNELFQLCKSENIPVEMDPYLVRGLDYYNDLVFEVVAEDNLGSQNTVLAGGRYDNLVKSMGGSDINAIGWGAGLERLMLLSNLKPQPIVPVGLVYLEKNQSVLSQIANKIRKQGTPLFVPTTGNFSKKMQKCERAGCVKVIILGEEELKTNRWSLKDLTTGEQKSYEPTELLKLL